MTVRVGAPAQDAEGDAHALGAGRRGIVDQELRVADVARADRERPVVAGAHRAGRGEADLDAVPQLNGRAGEVGHRQDVVPQAEEEALAAGLRDRPEQVLGEVELGVAGEHRATAVDEPPLLGERGRALGAASIGDRPESLEVEALQAGAQDWLSVGPDRDLLDSGVERAAADQPAVEARVLEHRRAAVHVGDLDSVQVVLEAAVAAADDDRAVPVAHLRRLEADGQPPPGPEVVVEPVADLVTALPRPEPQQPQRQAVPDARGRVDTAERRLDQLVRHLEGADLLAPQLEHDRVACACGPRRRAVAWRGEIGRNPLLWSGARTAELGEQAACPHWSRVHRDRDVAAGERRAHDCERVGARGRHSGHVAADCCARRVAPPAVAQPGLVVPVGVGEDAALLLQHRLEVGVVCKARA